MGDYDTTIPAAVIDKPGMRRVSLGAIPLKVSAHT
jgi:hypothetical protein